MPTPENTPLPTKVLDTINLLPQGYDGHNNLIPLDLLSDLGDPNPRFSQHTTSDLDTVTPLTTLVHWSDGRSDPFDTVRHDLGNLRRGTLDETLEILEHAQHLPMSSYAIAQAGVHAEARESYYQEVSGDAFITMLNKVGLERRPFNILQISQVVRSSASEPEKANPTSSKSEPKSEISARLWMQRVLDPYKVLEHLGIVAGREYTKLIV